MSANDRLISQVIVGIFTMAGFVLGVLLERYLP
jgi:hypothetical protein